MKSESPGEPRRDSFDGLSGLAPRRSEELHRKLVETIPDAVIVTDLAGRIVFANQVAERLAAPLTVEHVLGQNMFSLVVAEDAARAAENTRLMFEGPLGPREYRLTFPGGTEIVAEVNGDVLRDPDGSPYGLAFIVRDITGRKLAEEALRASEERYRQLAEAAQEGVREVEASREALRLSEEKFAKAFHGSPDAININRLDNGMYVDVNPGFTAITGYTRDDVAGRTSSEINIWADPADRDRLVDQLVHQGRADHLEAAFRLKDGTVRLGLMSARVMTLGDEPHIISITRDVEDLKRAERERATLEQQLAQAQKMEAVGRLAGGVAHDFNNLLTVILGHAELLRDRVKGDLGQEDVAAIHEAAERAAALTGQLLAFSRKTIARPRITALGPVARNMESMLRRLLGEDIDLRIIDTATRSVNVDPTQFEQVVMNLAVNARDAMPDGGRLTVAVADVDLADDGDLPAGPAPARTSRLSPQWAGLAPGAYVSLRVSDTGCGMDAVTLSRLFEPFFTTKERGKGTGLGLSTVHGIVSQNGGQISVISELGLGSTFTTMLPAVADAIEAPRPSVVPVAAGGGTEQILLVEDDAAVRRLSALVLRRHGYAVVEAEDGQWALAACEKARKVDLVITDLVMPGIGGIEVAERVAALCPGIKVLLLSGYTEDVSARRTASSGGIPFLQKPFAPAVLLQKVRDVLDGVAS